MPRVTAPSLARVAASALVAVSAAVAAGCASDPEEATGPPPAPPGTTTTTAPPGLAAVETRCDPTLLSAPVQARQPGAVLTDIVCERPFAVATVTGPAAAGGEAVLLRAGAEGWAVVSIGPLVPGQPVPEGFSTSMVARWHAQFRPPPPPAPEEPTTGSGESVGGGGEPICVEEPAFAEDGTELPPVVVCEEPPGPVIL